MIMAVSSLMFTVLLNILKVLLLSIYKQLAEGNIPKLFPTLIFSSVRFNPNLYNCGKVCLSLLGTWSGGTNEKWDPSTSTLLQVLVSIQSLILVDQPFFNEPGYESQMNTASGQKQSNEYNEVIRAGTLKWAILEQLKNPSAGFEEAIKLHFKLKKELLLKQCADWAKDAQVSRTAGFGKKIQGLVDEIKVELAKLDETEEKKE